MGRASIHEQYDVGTKERLEKARKAERTGTSGTGETGETGETSGTSGTSETSGTGETGGTGGNKKKLPYQRQLNSLLYTNYLIIHHLHNYSSSPSK